MRLHCKIWIIIFFIAGIFLSATAKVAANENFSTTLQTTYLVNPGGGVTIDQAFTITNKTPTLFVKQYALEFGAAKLLNVKVFDDKGPVNANVVSTDNKTSIGISFGDMIVGEGKKRKFTVQFTSRDAAVMSGNVLEVYVPKLSTAQEYDSYQVVLKIPTQFGSPARVTPSGFSTTAIDGYTVLTFANLKGEGVTALFGREQIFDYTLTYHLNNPTGSTGVAQVALPPDTARQKVEYLSLEPLPLETTLDPDGNWIATYQLEAGQDTTVVLDGKVSIFLDDQVQLPLTAPSRALTSAQKYWESDQTKIAELAKKNQTPRQIFNYVVSTLSYDYSKVKTGAERMGALKALENPKQAVCQEFTDTFITLARANGIPARRATGYAHTENDRLRPLGAAEDILHAWPEYFDQSKQVWVPIDPTWENTTGGMNYFDQFDFNHFTFAYNGESSQTPYGAGAYKLDGQKTKDVEVRFGKEKAAPAPNFTTSIKRSAFWQNMLQGKFELSITNTTGAAWYHVPISIELPSQTPATVRISDDSGQVIESIPYLLPFQSRRYLITLSGTSTWQTQSFPLTLTVQGLSSSHELSTGFTIDELVRDRSVISVGVGGGVVFLALIGGSLLVSRRKRQRPVRR